MDQLVQSLISLGYHYVLIDCPAGIDVGFINAISPAKEAIIVTTPEITAIRWEGPAAAVSIRPSGHPLRHGA
jgi:septum site-determining protein MinD